MNSPISRLLKISVISFRSRILSNTGRLFILFMCAAAILIHESALADKIILKDGTIEESDRVWESEHFVHFILKGTQTVEVRYAKKIVERIEHDLTSPGLANPTEKQSHPQSNLPKPKPIAIKDNLVKHPALSGAAQKNLGLPDEKYIFQNRKVSFYDPHRAKRYWASRNSRHASLEGALEALAQQYGRTRKWVEDHMGSENDLGEIHANLMRQRTLELHGAPEDLNPVGAPITKPQAVPPPTRKMPVAPKYGTKIQSPKLPEGIKFYDPRRKHKYWTSQAARYDTLSDAVNALAEQYNAPAEWIEEHLGSSNDLSKIHSSIQKSMELRRDAMP